MDIEGLEAQAARLVLDKFSEGDALALGLILVDLAKSEALPVVIDIRTPDRTLFHVAMPGSAPVNGNWARRKSNTAFMFQAPSLLVGARFRAKGQGLAVDGLDPSDYADHGGSVPITVRGTGCVAAATVSGLPQVEDHALVVRAIEALMAQ